VAELLGHDPVVVQVDAERVDVRFLGRDHQGVGFLLLAMDAHRDLPLGDHLGYLGDRVEAHPDRRLDRLGLQPTPDVPVQSLHLLVRGARLEFYVLQRHAQLEQRMALEPTLRVNEDDST